MGMRFRRSIGLGPGVRLNLSKTGIGISAGVKGARYSVHSSGRETTSARLPGTGVYYMKQTGGHGSHATAPASHNAGQAAAAPAPHAGLFSPAYEKRFAEGVKHFLADDTRQATALFVEAAALDSANKAFADDFFAGVLLAQAGAARSPSPTWRRWSPPGRVCPTRS